MAADNDAWSDPVITSQQTGALFSDKDEAVATGPQTAEAEEPRCAEDRDPNAVTEDPTDAPDVQQECPANLGNSDIFGGSWADPNALVPRS